MKTQIPFKVFLLQWFELSVGTQDENTYIAILQFWVLNRAEEYAVILPSVLPYEPDAHQSTVCYSTYFFYHLVDFSKVSVVLLLVSTVLFVKKAIAGSL